MSNKISIDEIDTIILKNLLSEARTSFTEIAKDCGISVVAVRMRYKRLKKLGIIKGEIMLISPFGLGYKYCSLMGIITEKGNEDKVIEVLRSKGKPLSPDVFRPFGKYSLAGRFPFRRIKELTGIQRDLEAIPAIKHADPLIWSDNLIPEHPTNLAIKPFVDTGERKGTSIKQEEIEIDKIDRKIAIILSQEARTPFRKIAEQLGISTKTVIERYRKLRGNVLTLSTITVDLNKLGYNAAIYFFIKLTNRSKSPEIVNQLLKIPNIIFLVTYIGTYDIFTRAVVENFQDYFKLQKEIDKIQNIERKEIFIVENENSWPQNLFAYLL